MKAYYRESKEEVLKELGANEQQGLTSKAAQEKLAQVGPNALVEGKKKSVVEVFLEQFKDLMVIILIVAAVISAFTGNLESTAVIIVVLILNAILGTVQHVKAEKSLEALKSLSAPVAKVLRDGKKQEIAAKDVVPGDILLLEAGDLVTADGRILDNFSLQVNESSLTGESTNIDKLDTTFEKEVPLADRVNMVYSSSLVTYGRANVLVTATGMDTEIGKIATLMNETKERRTPLQVSLDQFSSRLATAILIFCALILGLQMWRGQPLLDALLFAVALAVAAIPEALSSIVTIVQAMGTQKMAKEHAIIKNLAAVESLGSVSVICSDKTGTLTQNKMTVKETYPKEENFLQISLLACLKDPYDPMELAIQEYCFAQHLTKKIYQADLVHEYVFNNEDKMMGQVWKIDKANVLCVKGAYEHVLPLCDMEEAEKEKIEDQIAEYSRLGYRILAVAKRENISKIPKTLKENSLTFVGLIALVDPPRKGVKESLASCYTAGVRVIMITGDNGETAKGIAKQIHLEHNENVITGLELENMSEEELKERVKDTNIFARVYPNHKMRIVKALQENKEVVAMTGDGVNDAPALKKAEIGIAMGKRGTNVAKEAADMILLDDNFNTIVDAIKNGRTIYSNIKKAISYILVIHIPIAFASFFVPLFRLPVLVLPIHIVLLELIIDPTSSIIFQRLKPDRNVMEEKPRKINEPIMNKRAVFRCVLQGLAIFLAFFGSYFYLLKQGSSQNLAMTFAFTVLVLANVLVVYVLQSREYALKNFIIDFKDKVIVLINSIIVVMLLLLIYVPIFNQLVGTVPLRISQLLLAFLIALLATVSFDLLKKKR